MRGSRNYSSNTWSGNWGVLNSLIPYFMEFRTRVILAMTCLIFSKFANITIPFVMKYIVDSLDTTNTQIIILPISFLIFYGILRFSSIILGEIRDTIFGRVTEHAMRRIGLNVFQHIHSLDIAFHLSRKTGGLSRDIERGTNGISFLMRFLLFNILPTLLEILLVTLILLFNYGWSFALIILVSVITYITYSIFVTDWRTNFVKEVNEMDNRTNTFALDSLLNFETVKYFTNEKYEATEYDKNLGLLENARMRNRLSLVALNSGQALVISISITLIMILAAQNVVQGNMTLGDLVLVNAYMLQLFLPLNFLGFVYREIKRALADVEHLFSLMNTKPIINDKLNVSKLKLENRTIKFNHVNFSYNSDRNILSDISFTVPSGQKIAIVGPSGSGKSTIARLLFRFYDVDDGSITIDNLDIRDISQESLRQIIGIVPQDTVLFNNSIYYNIAYGNPGASEDDIIKVADMSHLTDFINSLPNGYKTLVGERGLKVSGGEKQRIAIARMLLKNPSIMVFDEATSSLDSSAEQTIVQSIRDISSNRTSVVIAHRLSTIIDADTIIVLRHGKVVEMGSHQELLSKNGIYQRLWELQNQAPNINLEGTVD
jgi:ABC-type transport system involved in Fe-S cluster assembly fused permease/ATPase subunit